MKTSVKKSNATLLIEQEVKRQGFMNFAQFMDIALYHPTYGYYNQKSSPRGREGDYFTSLQVSSLFPKIIANAVLQMKEALECTPFTLIEFGSGDGEFLSGVLMELEARKALGGIRVVSVEKSRTARDKLSRKLSRFPRVQIVSDYEEADFNGPVDGVIFTNEFVDALPFHRLRWTGSVWKEIGLAFEEGLKIKEKDFEGSISYLDPEKLGLEPGQEVELRPAAGAWMRRCGDILARGYVLTFDYGYPRLELTSPKRMKGTWQCFYRHQASEEVLSHIGEQDITAHIDFNQLDEAGKEGGFESQLFCSQAIFLSFVGKTQLETYLKTEDPAEQKKRAGEVQQLVHPQAMGEAFWALLQAKEAPFPSIFTEIPNRVRRLNFAKLPPT